MISGTPEAADTDTASVTVTVSDTASNTATVGITFPAVAKGDQTLSGFSYSASSVTFGSAVPTLTAPGGVAGGAELRGVSLRCVHGGGRHRLR